MRYRYFLFILTLAFAQLTYGQINVVEGTILNQEGRTVSMVKIQEVGAKSYTYSDDHGHFVIQISSSQSKLQFVHSAYNQLVIPVQDTAEITVFLSLAYGGNGYDMGGKAGYSDFNTKNTNKQLQSMPYFLGEADVNRQIQMLPGVDHGNEGFSNLLVRGGNVDENLMLYNGTPIYNYNHIFGLSSVFHASSINDVRLHKGISSARYGGRLSSVIELETAKNAEFTGLSGDAEISMMTASINVRNIKADQFFTFSLRRSYIDQFFPTEFRQNDFNIYLYDVQMNYGKDLANGNLEINFLNTKDHYFLSNTFKPDSFQQLRYDLNFDWGNTIGAVKYKQFLSKRLKAEHSVHFSRFGTDVSQKISLFSLVSSGGVPTSTIFIARNIREYIGQSNWNYIRDNLTSVEFGTQLFCKTYRPSFATTSSKDFDDQPDEEAQYGKKRHSASIEWVTYGEMVRFFDNMKVSAGLRNTLYYYDDFIGFFPEPRLHISIPTEKGSTVKFGYNRHFQFTRLVNSGGTEGISNFWVPATSSIQPQRSDIINAEFEHKLGEDYALSVGAYAKWLTNIYLPKDLDDVSEPGNDWQDYMMAGSGMSYGFEAMILKNTGLFTGWLSYAYTHSERYFEDLASEPFLFDFDRPHMFKLYGAYQFNDEWDLGVNFLYGNGKPFSLPQGKFVDIYGNIQLDYSSINNYRSQNYQRLDLSVSKSLRNSQFDNKLRLYLYNVLNTRNPLDLVPEFEQNLSTFNVRRVYVSVVPGISYSIKF